MKYIIRFLLVILTSLCVFPIALWILPGYNLKMLMAAIGLVLVGIQKVKEKDFSFDRGFLCVSVFAALISLATFFSMTVNNTIDNTLLGYLISAWVWLAAAYVVCSAIKAHHKYLDFVLVSRYLVAVAFFQCVLALVIDAVPAFQNFVQGHFICEFADTERLQKAGRIYGIGAALDFSGIRFACILILLAQLYILEKDNNRIKALYLGLYVFITIIGCMIARTTITGAALGLGLIAINFLRTASNTISRRQYGFVLSMAVLAVAAFMFVTWKYNSDIAFREHLRFGFEGFFNFFEEGSFETSSTNTLKSMYVFPDNVKTWLIGDGYFQGQSNDPNYLGEDCFFFYKGTDVGYLRFIFYFGIIGLVFFICVYVAFAHYCAKGLPTAKFAMYLILLENLIVWLKVASDVFVIFAVLMCTYILQTNKSETTELNLDTDAV